MTEFRIEYTITRCQDGDLDFIEIGFGSSGAWGSPEQASYMADCAISRGEWETDPGMPDPADVLAAVEAGADTNG